MASAGLNLHFQCHRLIHFDLPWSLLRFQQRNGRIDRYGQDRNPEIYYFVAATTHPKIRQMWVLDKLVEKDEAARQGVGDPAVFLNAGDVDRIRRLICSGQLLLSRSSPARKPAGNPWRAVLNAFMRALHGERTQTSQNLSHYSIRSTWLIQPPFTNTRNSWICSLSSSGTEKKPAIDSSFSPSASRPHAGQF